MKSPFKNEIIKFVMRMKFKMFLMQAYQGWTSPREHLETYVMTMELHGASDPIICRVFPTTVKGTARAWYHQLKLGSVCSFEKLAQLFSEHFCGKPKYLKTVKQGLNKSLREFLLRFNHEALLQKGLQTIKKFVMLGRGCSPTNLLSLWQRNSPRRWVS